MNNPRPYLQQLPLLLIAMVFALESNAQCGLYQLSFADTSTYNTSCGNTTGAHWTTTNDSCALWTPIITVPGDSAVDPPATIPISVRLNPSGNLDQDDHAYIQYCVNGVWYTHQVYSGDTLSAVFIENFNITVAAGSEIKIRVLYENDHNSEKWRLFDGDICVDWEGTLPVELIFFKAHPSDLQVELTWATASETNNDHFEIERSADALSWESIKTMDGAGNSASLSEYDFTDEMPLNGPSYYRLKQVDHNGDYEYSKVVSVHIELPEAYDFSIYPNPALKGDVFINFDEYQEKELMVVLCDPLGKVVFSKVVLTEQNDGVYVAVDKQINLSPGIYLVIGSSENRLYNQKLVVGNNTEQSFNLKILANR